MKNINVLYLVSILLLTSSCASWSFKGKDTKYKVSAHIKVFMNKEPMKRQCKIFLNDHIFFSNEGNTSYANQPVVLYTNKKRITFVLFLVTLAPQTSHL